MVPSFIVISITDRLHLCSRLCMLGYCHFHSSCFISLDVCSWRGEKIHQLKKHVIIRRSLFYYNHP